MNDGKKVYVISNSNTRTIDNNLIKRQEEIARRANQTKTIISVLLIMIIAICIILVFYLIDGLGRKQINEQITTFPVTLNVNTTTSSERVVYTPRSTVQSEATHTYKR